MPKRENISELPCVFNAALATEIDNWRILSSHMECKILGNVSRMKVGHPNSLKALLNHVDKINCHAKCMAPKICFKVANSHTNRNHYYQLTTNCNLQGKQSPKWFNAAQGKVAQMKHRYQEKV